MGCENLCGGASIVNMAVGGIGERIKINSVANKTKTQLPIAANAIIYINWVNKVFPSWFFFSLVLPSIIVVSNNSQTSLWSRVYREFVNLQGEVVSSI